VKGNDEVGDPDWADFTEQGVEGVAGVAHEEEGSC